MSKFTKKQEETIKNLCNKIMKEAFYKGCSKGELSILKHFRDESINGLNDGCVGISNTAIINFCNQEIDKINEELINKNDKIIVSNPVKKPIYRGRT